MSLKITISQSQKLVLTPHIQQSLEILQMDSISLKEKIEKELIENPMLEELHNNSDLSSENTIDIFLNDDTSHNDYVYFDTSENAAHSREPFNHVSTSSFSLYDYLCEQLIPSTISPDLLSLVQYLILNLDNNGWLHDSPDIISKELNIPTEDVTAALQIIQNLEPAGVGASGFRESLLIQAQRLNLAPATLEILKSDVCLKYLSNNQITKIAETLGIDNKEVRESIQQILSLDPKPAASFGNSDIVYVIPDAYVKFENSEFSIIIGNSFVPEIQISGEYYDMIKDDSDPKATKYLSDCLKQAQSLINSIAKRNKTLFLCVTEIVRQQPDYFKNSNGFLSPMTLDDVAENINLSVSTVSRTIKNKYISCCHGIVPLHSFFTSRIKKMDSEEAVSSQEIQRLIQKLVDEEDKQNPLSDPAIAQHISDEGYNIARRTITKYRTQLGIPPASQRKVRD